MEWFLTTSRRYISPSFEVSILVISLQCLIGLISGRPQSRIIAYFFDSELHKRKEQTIVSFVPGFKGLDLGWIFEPSCLSGQRGLD